MREILRLLTLTCEEISSLVSAGMDRELPRSQRLAVRLHLLYCTACRRYRRHLHVLRKVLRHMAVAAEDNTAAGPTLRPQARERIKKALSQE